MKRILLIFAILLSGAIFGSAANAQETDDSNKTETKVEGQNDRNVKIKSKPRLQYARQDCNGESGVVRLRVTFDKSEKITDVEIAVSSGCNNFDKMAVKAAKKIKFKPAMRNGKPVTTRSLIEYTFTIY